MQYSIKELRARLNETQTEVAKAVGVSVQTYCAWETGELGSASFDKVLKLSQHFGVSVAEIKL